MSNDSPEPVDSPRVRIYDTTLRDGTQGEGISLTARDKLRIALRLDHFGIAFIEGGWPGSNPKDAEFFERARDLEWKSATIAAFGSTRRAKVAPDEDPSIHALVTSGARVCTIFGKTWTLHVQEVLRISLDENLQLIEDTCGYLRSQGRRVIYDAEHFFDGYSADPEYALATLEAARRGGAEVLVMCDTNGGNLPWMVEQTVRVVRERLGEPSLGIHAHNDTGCAVANSLAAVRAGARHVQGTINGYGERCGNANLTVVIPNCELKLGLRCVPEGRLVELSELSAFVAEVANAAPDHQMPYVGRSAFAHKAGVHVAALRRNIDSYQHVDPEVVGNSMRVVVSELSGRGNVLSKAEELGVHVAPDVAIEAVQEIKEAEARGLSYESAEASVALLLKRRAPNYERLFDIIDYAVTVAQRRSSDTFVEAVVKVRVGEQVLHTAADGNGPVSALDAALRKALAPVYPAIQDIHLDDYKVRILDSRDGAEAITRVLIDTRNERRSWSTVGASANIIEASMQALVDGIEFGLLDAGTRTADALDGSVFVTPPSRPPPPMMATKP
jgi:2-isopropylmalate synthase